PGRNIARPHHPRRTCTAINANKTSVVRLPVEVQSLWGEVHEMTSARTRLIRKRRAEIQPRFVQTSPAILAVLGIHVGHSNTALTASNTDLCVRPLCPPIHQDVRIECRVEVPVRCVGLL